jgi:uncharacterized Tic20 family protein
MEEKDRLINADEEEGEAIPVRVRESVKESIKRAAADAEEFEQLSQDLAQDDEAIAVVESKAKNEKKRRNTFKIPPQHRRPLRPDPIDLDENERTWAALAHASALLTMAVAIGTLGIGSLLTIFIPLAIYIYYREKSEFVAHHALQAFAAQVVGIIGFVVLLMTVLVVWVTLLVIAGLLSIILIGIPFLILMLLLGPIALAATFALPLGMLVYGMIAAAQSWGGHNYSYPWIGDWVDDQLYG